MQRCQIACEVLASALLEGGDEGWRAAALSPLAASTALAGGIDEELHQALIRLPVSPAAEAALTLYPLLHVLREHPVPQGGRVLAEICRALPLDDGDPGFAQLVRLLGEPAGGGLEPRWREAVAVLCREAPHPVTMSLEWEAMRRAHLALAATRGADPACWPREAFLRLREIEVAFY